MGISRLLAVVWVPCLYDTPSGPSGLCCAAAMKSAAEPSMDLLCCLTMASKADFVAVTQASRGPYRSLTCTWLAAVSMIGHAHAHDACDSMYRCHLLIDPLYASFALLVQPVQHASSAV